VLLLCPPPLSPFLLSGSKEVFGLFFQAVFCGCGEVLAPRLSSLRPFLKSSCVL